MVSALIERPAWRLRNGCAGTSRPIWFRWCTASMPTSWPSCRTRRSSSWGDRLELPDEVARIKTVIPDEEKVLAIFTDVFRFLSALLEEDGKLSGEEFWRTAAAFLRQYQGEHPELAEQFARHELFAADFPLSCLNRLQPRNNQQMTDLADPSGGLQMAGRLLNPLARFA